MLTVLALVAIATGMLICAGSLASLWIASRRQGNEGSTHVEIGLG
jgi:uncharacterized protein (DUF3084 family)